MWKTAAILTLVFAGTASAQSKTTTWAFPLRRPFSRGAEFLADCSAE